MTSQLDCLYSIATWRKSSSTQPPNTVLRDQTLPHHSSFPTNVENERGKSKACQRAKEWLDRPKQQRRNTAAALTRRIPQSCFLLEAAGIHEAACAQQIIVGQMDVRTITPPRGDKNKTVQQLPREQHREKIKNSVDVACNNTH